jgi:hypothetical protein
MVDCSKTNICGATPRSPPKDWDGKTQGCPNLQAKHRPLMISADPGNVWISRKKSLEKPWEQNHEKNVSMTSGAVSIYLKRRRAVCDKKRLIPAQFKVTSNMCSTSLERRSLAKSPFVSIW